MYLTFIVKHNRKGGDINTPAPFVRKMSEMLISDGEARKAGNFNGRGGNFDFIHYGAQVRVIFPGTLTFVSPVLTVLAASVALTSMSETCRMPAGSEEANGE